MVPQMHPDAGFAEAPFAHDVCGGTPQDERVGVTIWGVGQSPCHEVKARISGV